MAALLFSLYGYSGQPVLLFIFVKMFSLTNIVILLSTNKVVVAAVVSELASTISPMQFQATYLESIFFCVIIQLVFYSL